MNDNPNNGFIDISRIIERLETKLETALARGLDRVNEETVAIRAELRDARERLAALDAKLTIQMENNAVIRRDQESFDKRLTNIERQIAENKGRDRVATALFSLAGGGIVSVILMWIGRL